MLQVKPMRPSDFSFAVELANTMNWNMAVEDFEFMTSLERDGCFVAFQDSEPIGIATSISFGRVGWFGNLIVTEKYRKQGVGSFLVKHAVNYLQSKGVQTIGLYAYPNLVNFYSSVGFKPDADFSVLQTENLGLVGAEALLSVGRRQVQTIEGFDSQWFGGDRKKLLESIILEKGNLSYYFAEGDEVVGYVAATVYEKMAWLGPLICQPYRFDAATSLVKAVLSKLSGKSIFIALPKKPSPLKDEFFKFGFKEDFFVTRMYLGEAAAKNCIYIAESLERG